MTPRGRPGRCPRSTPESWRSSQRSMPTPLERLRRLVDGKAPPPPIADLIGFTLTAVTHGEALIELAAGPQHANPMGTLHGGVLCDIADAAMGIAFGSTLGPEESFTTVEMKINFFRPVWKANVKAEGKFVRRGKTIG